MGRESDTEDKFSNFYDEQERRERIEEWIEWQQEHCKGTPWPGYRNGLGATSERMELFWRRWCEYVDYKNHKSNNWEKPPALDCYCQECSEKMRRMHDYEYNLRNTKTIEKTSPFFALWLGGTALVGAVSTWLIPVGLIFQLLIAIVGGLALALFINRKT